MRRILALTLLALLALETWSLLGYWIQSGAERAYPLIPPIALGLCWLLSPVGWKGLKQHCLPVGVFSVVALLITTVFVIRLSRMTGAFGGSPRSADLAREVILGAYFLGAVTLVIGSGHRLIKRALNVIADLTLGRSKEAARGQARTSVIALATAALLLPAVLPYAIAVLYVHRFKLPLISTPAEAAARPFEDVAFMTSDDFTIRGWYIPARVPGSSRTLLICHGLGANRSVFLPFLKVADRI